MIYEWVVNFPFLFQFQSEKCDVIRDDYSNLLWKYDRIGEFI